MNRTGVAAAVNATVVPQVQYGIDPRGWSMFAALAGRQQRGMNGQDGRIYGLHSDDPAQSFYGYTAPQQAFTGLAHLGKNRPIVDKSSELADASAGETSQDPAMRIFLQRMERRR